MRNDLAARVRDGERLNRAEALELGRIRPETVPGWLAGHRRRLTEATIDADPTRANLAAWLGRSS